MVLTRNRVFFVLGFVLAFLAPESVIGTTVDRPDFNLYPNPYVLMATKKIEGTTAAVWTVVSNRSDAPICDKPGGTALHTANYLEMFIVDNREGRYLLVTSSARKGIKGWMDMTHVICSPRAIMDPQTLVNYKLFMKVRLTQESKTEPGLNSLRLREGPGKGIERNSMKTSENEYFFITSPNEISHVGTLFYYVYGVHFNDETKGQGYQDASIYKDADFFLVGNRSSFSTADLDRGGDESIAGWIPREAAVLWDTRQALEKVSGRPEENWDAHKFSKRPILNEYFRLSSQPEKKSFLVRNSREIVRDDGEGPPKSGQSLRDIVLQVGQQRTENGIVSEYIGYTGKPREQGADPHQQLALMHQGAQFVEIFFIVDGTLSMEPCLEAAATVTRNLIGKLEEGRKSGKTGGSSYSVRGAIYRDVSEQAERKDYEEWDETRDPPLYEWFCPSTRARCGGKAFSNERDDYPENVFSAIKTAIDGWSKRFKDRQSVRIMVILGDAGDRNNNGWQEISRKLREFNIIPFVVQFDHKSHCKDETDAMDSFGTQFTAIVKENIESWEKLGLDPVQRIPESGIKGKLEQFVKPVEDTFVKIVHDMPLIRRGQKTLCETLCENAGLANNQGCIEACTAGRDPLARYVREHKTETNDQNGILNTGIALAYLEYLAKNNPELWELVNSRPESGFADGFMVLKKDDQHLTRPVLFMGQFELDHIMGAINTLRTRYRDCDSGPNRQFLLKAMVSILGELFQIPISIDPFEVSQVTREQLERWLGSSVVTSAGSFVKTDEIITQLCSDPKRWDRFLIQLEQVEENINNILRKKPAERLYLDAQAGSAGKGSAYFWIYPEELFPQPD